MDFSWSESFYGLSVGLVTFLIIGAFHPLVIKGEYYIGVRCWVLFLMVGVLAGILSILVESRFWSIICGVISFSSFWGILEVFEQRERVRKGWFPMNPRRRHHYNISEKNKEESRK